MNMVSHELHLSELSNANAVQSQSSMTLYRVNITYTYFLPPQFSGGITVINNSY